MALNLCSVACTIYIYHVELEAEMAASLANVVYRSIEIIVSMILNPGKCDALRRILGVFLLRLALNYQLIILFTSKCCYLVFFLLLLFESD